ncbi:hypothetical protein Hanom_Chr16g01426951 [Helianthus anomalus]
MSSLESSSLSKEHDPMAIISDDDIALVPEIFTSDSESDPEIMSDDEDLDHFQPFALPDFGDDIPFVDVVLALPLPIHDQLIMGIPMDWPFIVDLDIYVEVPLFEVDHPDDDLGDSDIFDIAILDVESPIVSLIDISSDSDPDSNADSWESLISSALRATCLEAYPVDDNDAMPVALATPTLVSTPTDTPPRTHTHVTSDCLS